MRNVAKLITAAYGLYIVEISQRLNGFSNIWVRQYIRGLTPIYCEFISKYPNYLFGVPLLLHLIFYSSHPLLLLRLWADYCQKDQL